MDSKKFECEPGDLIRIIFPPVVRGITVSAIEVTVTNVKKRDAELVVYVLLKPFSRTYYELVLDYKSQEWKIIIPRKRYITLIPVEKVSVLDGYKEL